MAADVSTRFTGLKFENPFLLASAPPTESDTNVMRAKTKFLRADAESYVLSMKKRPNTALHSSWNWELISDKPLDWWIGKLANVKRQYPNRMLIASIMAGSGNDKELHNWQTLV